MKAYDEKNKTKVVVEIILAGILLVVFFFLLVTKASAATVEFDLSTDAEATITGIAADDRAGGHLDGAGDMNGDGVDDIIICAQAADNYGATASGETYVIFSDTTWPTTFSSADVTYYGTNSGDQFGRSVSGVGDVNGDGNDDVIIGAFGSDIGGFNSGAVYVVYGPISSTTSDINGQYDVLFRGVNTAGSTELGTAVVGPGDVNGDNVNDMLLGAWWADPPGKTNAGTDYLLYGNSSFSGIVNANTNISFQGVTANDRVGAAISKGAGDIDNDGFDDMLMCSYVRNNGRGESYLVFGSSNITGPAICLGTSDVVFGGVNVNDYAGNGSAILGDVNNDGYDDFAIAANAADPDGKTDAGVSYIFFGKEQSSFSSVINLADADMIIKGANADDRSGPASPAGDVNNDGYDDFLITAGRFDVGSNQDAGAVYLIYGRETWLEEFELNTTDGEWNVNRFNGVSANDYTGGAAAAGDVDSDGLSDILISSSSSNSAAGRVYLMTGADITAANPATNVGGGDNQEVFFGGSASSGGVVIDFTGVSGNFYIDAANTADGTYGSMVSEDISYIESNTVSGVSPVYFATGDSGDMFYYFRTVGTGTFTSYDISFRLDKTDMLYPIDWYNIWHYTDAGALEMATNQTKTDNGTYWTLEGTLTSFSSVGVGANPEPATMVLFGVGLAGLGWRVRRSHGGGGKLKRRRKK